MQFARVIKKSFPCSLVVLLAAGFFADALGQRPFRTYDPFYRGETAKRAFHDGYAVTADVSYRANSGLQSSTLSAEGPVTSTNAVLVSFRVDYELASRLDLSAIMDASGGIDGRSVKLSWLALKHYWYQDGTDYALRLAVDPISEGGVGFRQTDLAFVSTTPITPLVTTDFAIGWRRVRIGLEQMSSDGLASEVVPSKWEGPNLVFVRAVGHEIHLMTSYNFNIDPAESKLFVSFLAEAGEYDVVETPLFTSGPSDVEQYAERVAGGVVWLWTGFQWNRPSYQVGPYFGLPLVRWSQSMAKSQVGVRFTVR